MFFDVITAWAGEGIYRVEACAQYLGKDISVSVIGGTEPHIGAVSLASYEPLRDSASLSTLSVYTHRDDAVASYFAKAISREMKCTVTVSAGLHIDNASQEDIALLKDNAAKCCAQLIEKLCNSEDI